MAKANATWRISGGTVGGGPSVVSDPPVIVGPSVVPGIEVVLAATELDVVDPLAVVVASVAPPHAATRRASTPMVAVYFIPPTSCRPGRNPTRWSRRRALEWVERRSGNRLRLPVIGLG